MLTFVSVLVCMHAYTPTSCHPCLSECPTINRPINIYVYRPSQKPQKCYKIKNQEGHPCQESLDMLLCVFKRCLQFILTL